MFCCLVFLLVRCFYCTYMFFWFCASACSSLVGFIVLYKVNLLFRPDLLYSVVFPILFGLRFNIIGSFLVVVAFWFNFCCLYTFVHFFSVGVVGLLFFQTVSVYVFISICCSLTDEKEQIYAYIRKCVCCVLVCSVARCFLHSVICICLLYGYYSIHIIVNMLFEGYSTCFVGLIQLGLFSGCWFGRFGFVVLVLFFYSLLFHCFGCFLVPTSRCFA